MNKIAIITAMREEAEHIINNYWLKLAKKIGILEIYESQEMVLALCGIWKIQATLWASFLTQNYQISKFINIWIAGSLLWDKASIWDVFLISKISQHDMYLPFDGEHLNYAKKEILINHNINLDTNKYEFKLDLNGYCLTWDQFIDDWEKVLDLANKYNASVCEMEAFAIASVAREFWILDKMIFIKAISDWADNEAKDAHMSNLDFAMENSIKVLKDIIW